MNQPDFSFMQSPIVLTLRAVLAREGESRFVGGVVRDVLAGRVVGDIDLATTLRPERVMALGQAAGLKVVPTGLAHGTVTLVVAGQGFEITTLRRDVATDGRHAEVVYTDSWQEDAARRDFTMNAMSLDFSGRLYDYFGGRDDLAAGRVRFVGEASRRIAEDYLRILRFFRFHAHYGRDIPDADSLLACREGVPFLARLSRERVRTELLKLLAAPVPLPTWTLLAELGAFAALGLPLQASQKLADLAEREQQLDKVVPLRRLAAATLPSTSAAELAELLRLSGKEAARLAGMMPEVEVARPREYAYWHGLDAAYDQLILAGQLAGLAELDGWVAPVFPLTGERLLQAGFMPGPQMGSLLARVEEWWVAEQFRPTLNDCLAMAKKLLA